MGTQHKMINGDSRCMSELPDNSIHLVITSPPYWQLKDYGMKYCSENNLLCYLYLENITFINAHLIKNKLAAGDRDMEFKYKEKFLDLPHQQNR
jgi:DNA modification methylase